MALRIIAFTHQGAVRPANEDTVAVGHWVRSEPMERPKTLVLEEMPALALVCDGMGGHAAGEVASRAIAEHLVHRRGELIGPQAITHLIDQANAELFALMEEQPAQRGMGTTVAGVVIAEDDVFVFNVGDSRVYGMTGGRLVQLSTDDTPGPKLDDGRTAAITSSTITQVLGGYGLEPLDVHVQREPAEPWQCWLIASDGLTDLVSPADIEACLRGADDEAIPTLFDAAMNAGGSDNVSLVLVRPART